MIRTYVRLDDQGLWLDDQGLVCGWTIRNLSMVGLPGTCLRLNDQDLCKAGRSGTLAGRSGTRVWLDYQGLECGLTKRDLSVAGRPGLLYGWIFRNYIRTISFGLSTVADIFISTTIHQISMPTVNNAVLA